MRIFDRPELVSAVRELPARALGQLIDRVGLEDAGELVALATTAQLERVLDDDLWQAARAGDDEAFRADRFALWLRIMLEGGEELLVRRLCELPQDLLALAVHRLVLVVDTDALAEHFTGPSEELDQLERAFESSVCDEWEEFRVIARDSSAWDDVWGALLALDRDHHDRLRAILEQCCAMTTEFINGQGTLYDVLTSDEMLENDVAAAREDRRAAEGFVSPADARSFLELARRGEAFEQRDPITHAYFREVTPAGAVETERPQRPKPARTLAPLRADVDRLVELLEEAEVVSSADRQALSALTAGSTPAKRGATKAKGKAGSASKRIAPAFEAAMSALRAGDPQRFSERVEELGFLVNVVMAGGEHEGRRPRSIEAVETVLKTCEAGLRSQLGTKTVEPEQALEILRRIPADRLFRQGFAREQAAAQPGHLGALRSK